MLFKSKENVSGEKPDLPNGGISQNNAEDIDENSKRRQ